MLDFKENNLVWSICLNYILSLIINFFAHIAEKLIHNVDIMVNFVQHGCLTIKLCIGIALSRGLYTLITKFAVTHSLMRKDWRNCLKTLED